MLSVCNRGKLLCMGMKWEQLHMLCCVPRVQGYAPLQRDEDARVDCGLEQASSFSRDGT